MRRMPSSVKPAPAELPFEKKSVGPSRKPASPGKVTPPAAKMGNKRTSDKPKPASV